MNEPRAIIIAAIIGAMAVICAAVITGVFALQAFERARISEANATAIVGTATQSIIETSEAPTHTPLPSQTAYPTYTSQPTHTPYPTYTPRPTLTDVPPPSATPTPSVVLPFQDYFDSGIRPEWRVLNGQPISVNGRLGAAVDAVTLEIGDNSWADYTVDFDFYGIYGDPVTLVIAGKLRYHVVAEYWESGGGWQELQNNRWISVSDIGGVGNSGHLRLIISVNTYKVFLNANAFFEMTYGSPMSGPFSITIRKGGSIDNLIITSP